MSIQDTQWDIRKIFSCEESYQEHTGDGIEYSDCVFLIDFGPFKCGHKCNISIDSASHGDFTMYVEGDEIVSGATFVPVWTVLYPSS